MQHRAMHIDILFEICQSACKPKAQRQTLMPCDFVAVLEWGYIVMKNFFHRKCLAKK